MIWAVGRSRRPQLPSTYGHPQHVLQVSWTTSSGVWGACQPPSPRLRVRAPGNALACPCVLARWPSRAHRAVALAARGGVGRAGSACFAPCRLGRGRRSSSISHREKPERRKSNTCRRGLLLLVCDVACCPRHGGRTREASERLICDGPCLHHFPRSAELPPVAPEIIRDPTPLLCHSCSG